MKVEKNNTKPVVILIAILGLAFSYLGYSLAVDTVKQRNLTSFNRYLDSYTSAIEKEITVHAEIMQNLQGLFRASTHVDRNEFKTYTLPIVERHKTLQALEWIPKVDSGERERYEQLAAEDGYSDFGFTWKNNQGLIEAVPQKSNYFPVFFIEPLIGNETALGFDLSSNAARKATLEQSRDSGQILATEAITLIQNNGKQQGVLLFAPIYNKAPKTVAERRTQLKGFVVAVIRLNDMVNRAIAHETALESNIAIKLTDRSLPETPTVLYQASAPRSNVGLGLSGQRTIKESGRDWRIEAWALEGFVSKNAMWPAYLILTASIIFTLMLVVYVYMLMNREQAVRRLVQNRTDELKTSNKRTQVILDAALDSIITINIQGIVQSFNPSAERLFGYQKEEVIGENVKMLMPSPYREQHDGYLSHYKETRERRIIGIGREVTGQRKDSSTFPLRLSVSEAELNGDFLYVGVIIDLTKQKQNEQLLIDAKEDAERMNRAKSEFLNMMSHELRTPLTVIMGYLPILKNKHSMPEPDMIAELACDMESSGEHLLALINDLLDISKIEAGKLELKKEVLSSITLANDVILSLKNNAQTKNIGLENQVEEFEFHADRVRLMQILINLVGNAIKFTEDGRITLSSRNHGDYVEFSVADTGCGIAEEELVSIFEKFHQVDSSSTRQAGGTGLGLAITKKLIELHGGEISVASTLNQGSTFTFTIKNNTGI